MTETLMAIGRPRGSKWSIASVLLLCPSAISIAESPRPSAAPQGPVLIDQFYDHEPGAELEADLQRRQFRWNIDSSPSNMPDSRGYMSEDYEHLGATGLLRLRLDKGELREAVFRPKDLVQYELALIKQCHVLRDLSFPYVALLNSAKADPDTVVCWESTDPMGVTEVHFETYGRYIESGCEESRSPTVPTFLLSDFRYHLNVADAIAKLRDQKLKWVLRPQRQHYSARDFSTYAIDEVSIDSFGAHGAVGPAVFRFKNGLLEEIEFAPKSFETLKATLRALSTLQWSYQWGMGPNGLEVIETPNKKVLFTAQFYGDIMDPFPHDTVHSSIGDSVRLTGIHVEVGSELQFQLMRYCPKSTTSLQQGIEKLKRTRK